MTDTIQAPVANAQMLVRRPVAEVFAAFVDPTITAHFWFTRASGPLRPGARVRWDWEMYGVGTNVEVKALEDNRRILIDWNGPEAPTSVEWTFETQGTALTLVRIRNWGFGGTPDEAIGAALDSTGGFSFVLAGLKAWLERGVELNLIADHDPAALVTRR
jgi:uncharacterized protein YndB with AHSA1/START domain